MVIFKGKEKTYRVLIFSGFVLIILVIFEFSIEKREVHFFVEYIPSFYSFLGFFSAYIIIFITYLAKKVGLKQKEDYYD